MGDGMSIQDDYFDLAAYVKGKPEAEMLERIWFAFCDLETAGMVRKGTMTRQQYCDWRKARVKELES